MALKEAHDILDAGQRLEVVIFLGLGDLPFEEESFLHLNSRPLRKILITSTTTVYPLLESLVDLRGLRVHLALHNNELGIPDSDIHRLTAHFPLFTCSISTDFRAPGFQDYMHGLGRFWLEGMYDAIIPRPAGEVLVAESLQA
jgi:hypothetical protein